MNKIENFAQFKKKIIRNPRRNLIVRSLYILLKIITVALMILIIIHRPDSLIGILLIIIATVNGAFLASSDIPKFYESLQIYIATRHALSVLEKLYEEIGDEVFKYKVKIIFTDKDDYE